MQTDRELKPSTQNMIKSLQYMNEQKQQQQIVYNHINNVQQ